MLAHLPRVPVILLLAAAAFVVFLPGTPAVADIHDTPNTTGSMVGKTIVISAGHGVDEAGSWDRGVTNGLKEDIHTNEIVVQWLTRYLVNAGARVHCARERSFQPAEIIVDNTDAGYSETGTWATSTSATDFLGANYRVHSVTTGGGGGNHATATWTPTIAVAGEYPVYVWFAPGSNRNAAAQYTVNHPAGQSVVTINQQLWRGSWIFLGTWHFNAGTDTATGSVTLSSAGTDAAQYVVADGVRLGSGTNAVHGYPRWMETAKLSIENYGYGNPNGYGDVTVRPNWAGWLTRMNEADQTWTNDWRYLAIHTNAGGGTGTSTFSYSNGRTPAWASAGPVLHAGTLVSASDSFSQRVQAQFVSDMRASWKSNWSDRGAMIMNFGELRDCLKMPSSLCELAFHDLEDDAAFIRQDRWRHDAARSLYKALARDFNPAAIIVPLPPKELRAMQHTPGHYTIAWTAVNDPLEASATPTGYKLYRSPDGRSWDDGTAVAGTTTTITADPGTVVYVRVAATNAGGESLPTEVLGVKVGGGAGPDGHGQVLIVSGFDRQFIWKVTDGAGNVDPTNTTAHYRDDYIANIGNAVAAWNGANGNVPFDSATNEAVEAGFVSLNDYRCVIWMLGEESTADDTLSAAEQAAVNAYLASGKPVSLFVSGAEVGWDLDYKGTSTDKAFMNTALSATYHADDANTHSVTGAAGMMFDGLSFSFGDGTSGAMGDYDVDYPDVLNTSGGSTAVLTYSNGAGAAATYRESGDTRVLTVGFPWERILGVAERNSAMAKALAVLLPDWQAPAEGNGDGGAGNLGGPAGGCGAVANADAMTLPLLALLLALLAWRRRD